MNTFYFTRDLADSLMQCRGLEQLAKLKDVPTEVSFNFILDLPHLKKVGVDRGVFKWDELSSWKVYVYRGSSLVELESLFTNSEQAAPLKLGYGMLYAYLNTPGFALEAPSKFTKEKQEAHFQKVKAKSPNWITVGFTYGGRKRTYTQELCSVREYTQVRNGREYQIRGHIRKFNNIKGGN